MERSEKQKEYYRKNREKILKRQKEYNEKHKKRKKNMIGLESRKSGKKKE